MLLELLSVFRNRMLVRRWGIENNKLAMGDCISAKFSRFNRNICNRDVSSTQVDSRSRLALKSVTRSSHSTSPYMKASANPRSDMVTSLEAELSDYSHQSRDTLGCIPYPERILYDTELSTGAIWSTFFPDGWKIVYVRGGEDTQVPNSYALHKARGFIVSRGKHMSSMRLTQLHHSQQAWRQVSSQCWRLRPWHAQTPHR